MVDVMDIWEDLADSFGVVHLIGSPSRIAVMLCCRFHPPFCAAFDGMWRAIVGSAYGWIRRLLWDL